MNKIYTLILLAVLIIGGVEYTQAQTSDRPWAIIATVGKSEYNGDRGNAMLKFGEPFHALGGVRVSRYLNPSFDLSLGATYGCHGFWETQNNFLAKQTNFSLLAHYKLANGYIMKEESRFAPFLNVGLGLSNYSPTDDRGTKSTDFGIPLGIGAKFRLNETLDLFWQSNYGLNFGGEYDENATLDVVANRAAPDDNKYLNHEIGLGFKLGKMADRDGDGVPDKKDACPDSKGPIELDGCPDSDGDGVTDKMDACPKIAGLATLNGCPDSDGDGIQDNKDACPNKAGLPKFKGCPDTDNDGISDDKDRCPTVAGLRANKGCPKVNESTLTIFQEALRGIHFETEKSVIKNESYAILNKVVSVMKKNPSYLLSIEGHTDSDGDDAFNLQLSKDRANAVKSYLVRNGVGGDRLTARGFGESKPVATNETAEGKALNRRVEFRVSF